MLRQARAFTTRALRTRALVVDVQVRLSGPAGERTWLHFPVLRFTDRLGRQVDQESGFGTNPAPARVGQVVEVLYDPADVTTVQMAGRPAGGCLGAAFVVLGLSFALPSVLVLLL